MKKNTKKKGFTLIELIVVIAILGILAAVLIPRFTSFSDKARRTQVVTDSKQIATAIDSLLSESTSGTLSTHVDTAATLASLSADPIVKLAGVDTSTGAKTLKYGADGSFTLTETLNSIPYTATSAARTGGAVAISVTP